MHPAVENLAQDQRLIEPALDELHHAAHELLASRPVEPERVRRCVTFVADMLQQRHYRKEEQTLFPALLAPANDAAKGSVVELQADHVRLKRALARAQDALPGLATGNVKDGWDVAVALAAFREEAHSYLAREREVLFPLVEAALPAERLQLLLPRLDQVDREYERSHPAATAPATAAGTG